MVQLARALLWKSDDFGFKMKKNGNIGVHRFFGTPMFIAAQLTVAKCWKNLSAHQQMSGSKNYVTFTQWNSMQQRERRSLYLCNSMDGTGEHYAK